MRCCLGTFETSNSHHRRSGSEPTEVSFSISLNEPAEEVGASPVMFRGKSRSGRSSTDNPPLKVHGC